MKFSYGVLQQKESKCSLDIRAQQSSVFMMCSTVSTLQRRKIVQEKMMKQHQTIEGILL